MIKKHGWQHTYNHQKTKKMLIKFETIQNTKHFKVFKKWLTAKEWMEIGIYDDETKTLMLHDQEALTIDALQQIVTFAKH